jgi:hypothetical protein
MIARVLSVLVVAEMTLVAASGAQRPEARPPAAVAAVVAQFKATEKSMGAARSALFSDTAVAYNAWDGRWEGRKAVDSLWLGLARSGTFGTSVIEEKATTYRQLGETLWLVDYLELLTGQRGPKSGRELPPRRTHMTMIVAREAGDQWRIVYYRAGDARDMGQGARAGMDSTRAP